MKTPLFVGIDFKKKRHKEAVLFCYTLLIQIEISGKAKDCVTLFISPKSHVWEAVSDKLKF